jgi:hypothetical protein
MMKGTTSFSMTRGGWVSRADWPIFTREETATMRPGLRLTYRQVDETRPLVNGWVTHRSSFCSAAWLLPRNKRRSRSCIETTDMNQTAEQAEPFPEPGPPPIPKPHPEPEPEPSPDPPPTNPIPPIPPGTTRRAKSILPQRYPCGGLHGFETRGCLQVDTTTTRPRDRQLGASPLRLSRRGARPFRS